MATSIDPIAERRKKEEEKKKAQSEAAELNRLKAEKEKKDKETKQKDKARIDLSVEEGLARSTQREIDHMKAEIRSFQSRLAQVRFAQENDVRLEHGIDLKIEQEEVMKRGMMTERGRKEGAIQSHKQIKMQNDAKIAALEADLKVMLQEVERKQRILKSLEGDTTAETDTKKAEFEEQSIAERIAASEAREQKMEQEKAQLKADEQKKEKEYQEMERKFKDVEAKLAQLEKNAQEYNRIIADLRRKTR
jgi:hypothetical protein